MEVDAAHRGIDTLTDALDALQALKERMGDVFTDKAYEQRKKALLKAAHKDAKVAAKVKGGGDTPSAPNKLSWTLINSAVGNGYDWESAFASFPFEIISGEWKSDRASPTSQVGGQEARRRCCDVDGTRYYARLVKNPKGQFALYQGYPNDASEGEAPPVKEEAKAVKEVRPPAHNCRSLLTQAPTPTAHTCLLSQLQLTSCTAHSSCCPFMCALLSLTATSHCLQDKKKTGAKAAAVQKKDDVEAEAKEEVPQKKAEGKKAGSKKAEGKKAEATVVDQPLDGEGNPVDTETCTATFIEEQPKTSRKRSKRG